MLNKQSHKAIYITKRSLLVHVKNVLKLFFLNDTIMTVIADIKLKKMQTNAGTWIK